MTPGSTISQPSSSQTGAEQTQRRSLWTWIPSLNFSQGIPYVIVMTMSVVMYKRLGISNTDIALYTSWLYLPWVVKPLWSPFVDITKTKRFWVISMQFLVSCGLGLAGFALRGSAFFKTSLLLFWIMAFASATHDIAADGFYMLSLTKHEQAWWVGLRSTFYRTAMIVGSGLLVVLAGTLESKNGLAAVPIQIRAQPGVAAASTFDPGSVAQSQSEPSERIVISPPELVVPIVKKSAADALAAISEAKKWNREHGLLQESTIAPAKKNGDSWWDRRISQPIGSVWQRTVSGPLDNFLVTHFAKKSFAAAPSAGNVGFVYVSLSKPPKGAVPIVVTVDRKKSGLEYVGLAKGDKGFRLIEGERLSFNSTNWNVPAAIAVQLDEKLHHDASVQLVATSGNISLAWSITLLAVASLFLAFSCWHSFMLPRPAADGPVKTTRNFVADFFTTLGSFFQKPGILLALAFILLYRFDEAQLSKVISPFLLDKREAGGLGLTTSQVGLVYGTFGIIALTCGGLFGGFTAAKYGLKRMLPIMVCSMYLPKLAFIFLSFTQPDNFLVTCGAVAVEQLGYGFGFTAFMLYLLYFADGPHKTAHYAICTGFMALGMMIPGMWSGWLADRIGYQHFFVWVIFSAIPGFCLAMVLKIDSNFGKKA